jgi:hypothetical protein
MTPCQKFNDDSIRNSQVRALVQPGDEKLMVFPHPSMAKDFQPAVVGKEPQISPVPTASTCLWRAWPAAAAGVCG